MFTRHKTIPDPDIAAAFRERVVRLGPPDRGRPEAERVRDGLGRTWRIGLRDRLEQGPVAPRA